MELRRCQSGNEAVPRYSAEYFDILEMRGLQLSRITGERRRKKTNTHAQPPTRPRAKTEDGWQQSIQTSPSYAGCF